MSRLAPLIARRAMLAPAPAARIAAAAPSARLDDIRLFLTGWIGGLIFFWTLLS